MTSRLARGHLDQATCQSSDLVAEHYAYDSAGQVLDWNHDGVPWVHDPLAIDRFGRVISHLGFVP